MENGCADCFGGLSMHDMDRYAYVKVSNLNDEQLICEDCKWANNT